METIATYFGYGIIMIIGAALFLAALFLLWTTIVGIHRIHSTKQTIRFLQKTTTEATYKALTLSINYLLSQGAKKDETLGSIIANIEKYKKLNNIKNT